MAIRLIIGLGNPGKKYEFTRHNIGRRVLEALQQDPPAGVFLLIPDSYMNTSGLPVAEVLRRKGIAPTEALVLMDDFELPLEQLRLRRSGSSGGHNGLNSIIETLQTRDIPRLRIGIGPVPEGKDPADFVLDSFTSAEKTRISAVVIPQAVACVRRILDAGLDMAMNEFNKRVDHES